MPRSGPIVIVENDAEDQDVLNHVLGLLEVKNELKFFDNGVEALRFLLITKQQPFLILCDVNMPLMNGMELRKEICKNDQLKRKNIPFIFLSTSADRDAVKQAYELAVQGFFKKQDNFGAFKKDLEVIVDYWAKCNHPNVN